MYVIYTYIWLILIVKSRPIYPTWILYGYTNADLWSCVSVFCKAHISKLHVETRLPFGKHDDLMIWSCCFFSPQSITFGDKLFLNDKHLLQMISMHMCLSLFVDPTRRTSLASNMIMKPPYLSSSFRVLLGSFLVLRYLQQIGRICHLRRFVWRAVVCWNGIVCNHFF